MVEALRGDLDERVRELERGRMPHLERRCVVHRLQLVRNSFRDLATAMSCVYTPETGYGIENLAAVRSPVIHPRGFVQKPRLGLELPVRGERHPIGFEFGLGHGALAGGEWGRGTWRLK